MDKLMLTDKETELVRGVSAQRNMVSLDKGEITNIEFVNRQGRAQNKAQLAKVYEHRLDRSYGCEFCNWNGTILNQWDNTQDCPVCKNKPHKLDRPDREKIDWNDLEVIMLNNTFTDGDKEHSDVGTWYLTQSAIDKLMPDIKEFLALFPDEEEIEKKWVDRPALRAKIALMIYEELEVYPDGGKSYRIADQILALFPDEEEIEKRGIDTAIKAYESTCEALIQEAVKKEGERIAGEIDGLYDNLPEGELKNKLLEFILYLRGDKSSKWQALKEVKE